MRFMKYARPLYGLALFGVLITLVVAVFINRQLGVSEAYAPEQPINFSHKLHAGKYKIDCQYCHFGAERGKHSHIPSPGLCLNCHNLIKTDSPEIQKIQNYHSKSETIPWQKVNFLPNYVYFNHAQHVAVGGVSCQKCHGNVEEMERVNAKQFNMGFCISCHRDSHIAVPNDTKMQGANSCSSCHY